MVRSSLLLMKCDDIAISVSICSYAFHLCLKRLSASRRASSDRSSHSNKKGPLICRSRASRRLSASFQHSQVAFTISCFASNLSASCTASHFVHPSFQNICATDLRDHKCNRPNVVGKDEDYCCRRCVNIL